MSLENRKAALRVYWKKKIQEIPLERKEEAALKLAQYPFPERIIASFSSFKNEISTHLLNERLAQKKQLVLPRIEEDSLVFYHVDHPQKELSLSSLGILEPIAQLCQKALKIDLILVPALAFDSQNHRLGYGKGTYDRVLSQLSITSIGVGYKEQLTDFLPHDHHDVALEKVLGF